MSEPVWIDASLDEIPAPEVLADIARKGHHAVLRVSGAPGGSVLEELVHRLARALPEHSVFLSGASQITVIPVITNADVLQIADELVAAAHEFRDLAIELCARLSPKLGIAREALVDSPRTSGRLDAEWDYHFHGLQCCFKSRRTGQVLDVELSFGDEFGVLDPWFFHRFLKTTDRHAAIAAKLVEEYHDTARALDVLEGTGRLRRVTHLTAGRAVHGVVAKSR
ncbi:hypothetical protein [Polyangium sp. y55x31]|uniref:DUF6896 domain-containing protein n=1 Tax=Polyangium sp. y55x31 TaxID=3042688 RepID=UPI0024831270|nr:hypothetical protein [Polyangium sp. y55x31]MDI1484664.1 hypothetical protein [Polyangium sp. y55x31]